MKQEMRTVKYDGELNVEAYHFQGIMQKFPNHFHDFYVIGCIEKGRRYMQCKNGEYIVHTGDVVVFNPKDVHTCERLDDRTLDYRSIHIPIETMEKAVQEITGRAYLPRFTEAMLPGSELAAPLLELYDRIAAESADFKKEELFLLLVGHLIAEYDAQQAWNEPKQEMSFDTVCRYLEENYTTPITLVELSAMAGLSKYHFLRCFTRQKGITPYSYLEAVRVGRAKALLEKGTPPIETALLTGFHDQSHFTTFFKKLIGVTPKQYMRIFTKEKEQPADKEN